MGSPLNMARVVGNRADSSTITMMRLRSGWAPAQLDHGLGGAGGDAFAFSGGPHQMEVAPSSDYIEEID